MSSHKELAENILKLVGGKENITNFLHCATRLRFNLLDFEKANKEEIESLPGVWGVNVNSGQLQVIIGQTVTEVYDEICKLADLEKAEAVDENLDEVKVKKKFSMNAIFDVLSSCFNPIIPAFAGAGVMKGLLTLCTTYGFMSNEAGLYVLLNAASDATFYFLPFLLAVTAAKKFKTDTTMAVVIAGIYMYPTIMASAGNTISIIGIDVTLIKYSSTVIPILLSVWIMSYVYRFIYEHTVSYLRVVIVPIVTLLIMAPLSIMVFGPLGYYAGIGVGECFKWLFNVAPWLGGLIDGATRPFVILTGMHMAMTPIKLSNLSTLGYDMLAPVDCVATMAAAGMCFGVFLRARKAENKSSTFSAFISAFIGITEPALYGVAFRFKKPLLACIIGGGISGAFVAMMGGKAITYAMPSIISLPAYTGSIPVMLIGLLISFVISAGCAYAFGLDEDIKKDKKAIDAEQKGIHLK